MSKVGINRRANRMAAMQFLFMWEANPPAHLPYALEQFFSQLPILDEEALLQSELPDEGDGEAQAPIVPTEFQPRENWQFAEEIVNGVIEHQQEIDEAISTHTKNWNIKRIARIDLAILRVAVYEMLFRKDIPPIVSINEAIDLSKEFSNSDSKRFINGILDQFKLRLNRPLRESSE